MPEIQLYDAGLAKKAKKLFAPMEGTNKEIKEMWTPVAGVARKIYSGELVLLSPGDHHTENGGTWGKATPWYSDWNNSVSLDSRGLVLTGSFNGSVTVMDAATKNGAVPVDEYAHWCSSYEFVSLSTTESNLNILFGPAVTGAGAGSGSDSTFARSASVHQQGGPASGVARMDISNMRGNYFPRFRQFCSYANAPGGRCDWTLVIKKMWLE